MSFRKFSPNDVVLNTMRAYPNVNITINESKIYYNNLPHQSGSFSNNILNITSSASGGISLFEYNIDRNAETNNFITAFVTKDSARASFKTVGDVNYENEFAYGDTVSKSYPLTASITREFMSPQAGGRYDMVNTVDSVVTADAGGPIYPHYYALKTRLNNYRYMSEHYVVDSSLGDGWNKDEQVINTVHVPSIFYGSKINPGSVSLKWYFTGSLIGELKDNKENGELIQTFGTSSANNNKVAGVVLYNEGIIMLTGSWRLNDTAMGLLDNGTIDHPKWIYFGAGALDGVNNATAAPSFESASFNMEFEGVTETQTYTMFANARRGEANYSNNPTYLEKGQDYLLRSGSNVFEENPNRRIKNITSSSFATFDEDFKRQVYVSRVAIYDDNKNLIGVATLADPVLKEEDKDITFKLKLDI